MAFPYVRAQADWKDASSATGGGDTSTPISATALDTIEAGIDSISDILELVDAAGDLLIASGDNAYAKLAKGSNDEILNVNAGTVGYRKLVNAMVDAAAAIAVSKLAPGSNGQILTTSSGTATWASAGTVTAVTALPGSPSNGDEIMFMDSLTAPTYAWHLKYISGKSSNKWQFLGGSPGVGEVQTSETSSSTTYTALATAGPTFVIPVAGDYDVGVELTGLSDAGGNYAVMSHDIGGTAASDNDWAVAGGNASLTSSRSTRRKALTAVTLTAQYKTTGGTGTFSKRRLIVTPVAIGG